MQQKKHSKNNNKFPCSSFKCAQVFGTNQSSEVESQDIISCLKYDPTGQYLCLGDCAGRIIIFQENKNKQQLRCQINQNRQNNCEVAAYDYFAEVKFTAIKFQSHVRQFDPLKGLQSSQEIVGITWLKPQGKYLKLLTTNTKSIKFWKAFQKTEKKIVKSANKDLSMPKFQQQDSIFHAQQKFVFPTVHSTQINSISHSNNEEYILSTDQQQCFLWSLQKHNRPYIATSIADRRKTATNQLSITCSNMHPKSDSIFVYGMNRCELGLCDIRISNVDKKVMDFGVETRSVKNFFTDMVATVGSVQFMCNGKYIVSRQYLNVKIWDMTNTKKPIHNICVQESLKPKLVNLFENDNIFDKFTICSSSDSSTILTGNYNNNFHLIDMEKAINMQYQLNFNKDLISTQMVPGKCPPIQKLDNKRKTSALAYHPIDHSIAVATLNCFFIYSV